CQCIQEGVWLRRLFGEFGHDHAGGVPVFVDNQSAIALAQNACLHGRTKHMQVRWHFIREMVAAGERGKLEASGRWGVHLGIAKDHKGPKWHWVRRLLDKEVRLEIVKTHQQAADIFTKRLADADHWKGMKLAGMSVH
ncbi:hypothetical protein CLOP_g5516, partial [Closterium sp. NIES-67]